MILLPTVPSPLQSQAANEKTNYNHSMVFQYSNEMCQQSVKNCCFSCCCCLFQNLCIPTICFRFRFSLSLRFFFRPPPPPTHTHTHTTTTTNNNNNNYYISVMNKLFIVFFLMNHRTHSIIGYIGAEQVDVRITSMDPIPHHASDGSFST